MKFASAILIALGFAFACIGSATAMTDEERASAQLLIDPSPAIARRVSITGRLYWTAQDKSLYPTSAGSPPPRSRCLPVLVGNGDAVTTGKVEKLNGKNVEVYGIISFVSEEASMISVNTCKQLGIYVISIRELESK